MLSFFPRGVLDEIVNLIESVFEGFPSYSLMFIQCGGYVNDVDLMYIQYGGYVDGVDPQCVRNVEVMWIHNRSFHMSTSTHLTKRNKYSDSYPFPDRLT